MLPPLANPTAAPDPAKPQPQIAGPAPFAAPPNAETLVGATPVQLATAAPAIVVEARPVPAREPYNPHQHGEGGPILPPRPTGRMRAHGGERSWLARNWPVFVIIVASIAIVLAVILMIWPKKDPVDIGTRNGAAAPAPERMDTNPLPPQGADPWQNGQPQVQPNPPAPPPDPDPDTTQIDPNDPFKDPFAGGGGLGGGSMRGNIGVALLGNIANRLCDKAKSCSDPTVSTMCSGLSMFPVSPIPSSCPQAKRCIEMIDQIDVCDGSMTSGIGGPNFPQLMMRTTDCMEALTSC